MKGNKINILKFPWFKNNPGDVGQYINTGTTFMEDSDLGRNVGVYRLQVKGKNKIGVNTEPGQHGWQFVMKAKQREKRVMKAAIALGVDPVTYSMGSTKVASLGEDELAFAGGLRGKPVELAKCESCDVLVPAQAEMIIEGEIPMEQEDEGPYGEMFGYMGRKHKNWYMNIKVITHRKNPWFFNDFTGVTQTTHMIPWVIGTYIKLKQMIPYLDDMYSPREAIGITVLSIEKKFPGQGITAGELLLGAGSAKIAIVVDKDVDVTNMTQVLHAVATRWQPHPASLIMPRMFSRGVDPSAPKRFITSKIVIDATRQLPEEGGPESWPETSRVLLKEMASESFDIVNNKWEDYWKNWEE